MPRGGELVDDAPEQEVRLRRRTFVGEARLRQELAHAEAFVVAAAGGVVVLGQAIEERARHGDLDPYRRVGGRGPERGGGR